MVLGSDWPLGPEENLTFDPLLSVQQHGGVSSESYDCIHLHL